jgi:hypothetical protein
LYKGALMSAETVTAATGRTVLGRYRGLITPGDECDFEYAGFPLPDGTFWRYREPDATVVVEHDRLRVAVHPLTRKHDRVQILDNAKHMYFSKSRVITPDEGEVSVEAGLRARIIEGRDEDLYSGFVSLHLLDFTTGLALDWFVANCKAASVYARLQFPGVEPADEDNPARPRYFCVFHEAARALAPGEEHRYRIAYDRSNDTVRFLIDGDVADVYTQVPVKMGQFIVALGIMTEKLIGSHGSVSLFGQGVVAEYTEVVVEGAAELRT